MIAQLPRITVRDWLTKLTPKAIAQEPFPLRNVLADSLYYPASGFDGDPVKHLGGNVLSFIYVDYGRSREELLSEIHVSGFLGYEPLEIRPVSEAELTPAGWRPEPPSDCDGDPGLNRRFIQQPFCYWAVFQRRSGVADVHGPDRFSLLYLCADGAAAFQALYVSNAGAPRIICIIQPGHSFGMNWTNYTDPRRILARSVLGNPAGQPEFLLHGGIGPHELYRSPCWPQYHALVCHLEKAGGGCIGLWSKAGSSNSATPAI